MPNLNFPNFVAEERHTPQASDSNKVAELFFPLCDEIEGMIPMNYFLIQKGVHLKYTLSNGYR